MTTKSKNKPAVRYSEAFKMQIVHELERGQINVDQIRRKYGIGSGYTIRGWVSHYGNGSVAKVIRVEKPEEINEKAELKRRVRALEKALADANIELVLERAYAKIALERAGIKDTEDFKKNIVGRSPRSRGGNPRERRGGQCQFDLPVAAYEPTELLRPAEASPASGS